jgi:PAS domain-containing protein
MGRLSNKKGYLTNWSGRRDHSASSPMSTAHRAFDFRQALLENTEQGVFAYGIDSGKYLYQNAAFEQLFGQTGQPISHPALLWQSIHPQDQTYMQENYRLLIRGAARKNLEFRLQLPHQAERWICLAAYLFEDPPAGGW